MNERPEYKHVFSKSKEVAFFKRDARKWEKADNVLLSGFTPQLEDPLVGMTLCHVHSSALIGFTGLQTGEPL